ncbi:MAG: monovalent cation/hydrogen antiporter [Candidatus Eremiobacteraeota bacterium]|jgi:CPA1 family monovalent cation:H+ antiporter|nr:monovalent cation/hydrogen antiporter [Candidatus Eremiobacteraeota bacterium]MEA2720588.1 monovalent cation/hydrogen antiporter [Candidatus Eremiobacteraeota bacterium]
MSEPVLLVLGLAAAVAFAIVSKRFSLPYPIVFVLAGTALAFVPGLPPVRIAPEWIFLSILPPLLFSGGWSTDLTLFRGNLRSILLLAVGLVVLSTVVVALVAHRIVPELTWPAAFVLGAIVSPPDAVAAIATFERFAVPRRIVAVLEGEGLVNDATALVIYRFAVVAAVAGGFSLAGAAGAFVIVALGGIAVGVAVEWCVERLARALNRFELSDSLIDNLIIIGTPYAAYLGGEALHVSGVLATVVAGTLLGRRSPVVYSPETRLVGENVWALWIYVINAYVFLAIGLQLRGFVQSADARALLPAALAISALLIVVRIGWVYFANWLPRALFPRLRERDPFPPWQNVALVAWTGMRGIVSLAAALALPLTAANSAPFPGRDAIVFITFVVIFVTLVGQGLSLIPLVRWLRLGRDEGDGDAREIEVRVAALEAGVRKIDELGARELTREEREVLERLRDEYVHRIEHLRSHATGAGEDETPASRFDHEAQTAALHAERRAIRELRDGGEIPDDIFRKVQYDLDLAETRLF